MHRGRCTRGKAWVGALDQNVALLHLLCEGTRKRYKERLGAGIGG
jgi:hypothetical protein